MLVFHKKKYAVQYLINLTPMGQNTNNLPKMAKANPRERKDNVDLPLAVGKSTN